MYEVEVRKREESSVPQNHSETQAEGESATCQGQPACQCRPVMEKEWSRYFSFLTSLAQKLHTLHLLTFHSGTNQCV